MNNNAFDNSSKFALVKTGVDATEQEDIKTADDLDLWSDDELRAFIIEHTNDVPNKTIGRTALIDTVRSIPDPVEPIAMASSLDRQ